MATLRERVASIIAGPAWLEEQAKVKQSVSALWGAYLDGPFQLPPDELIRQLGEYDSGIIADLVTQLAYDQIGGQSTYGDDETARQRAISESRRLWTYDPLAQWQVNTWTNFGFGEGIDVVPSDEDARSTWDEFWSADRNAPVLAADKQQQMSNSILTDGDLYYVFYIRESDGRVTLRTFAAEDVQAIETNPDDAREEWFYKRAAANGAVLYYPDWRLVLSEDENLEDAKALLRQKERNAQFADEAKPGTFVCVMHLAHNQKQGLHGWPILTTAAPWIRVHKRFREDRASVAASIAMYVNKLKTQGGSRAVEAMRAKLASTLSGTNWSDTNPATSAGATFVENQSAELSRLGMGTGASDAKQDGEALAWMAALGGGLFPHWAGMGDAYRLATASSMETPLLRSFSRYQSWWAAQFRNMVRIVLWSAEMYGGKVFEDYDCEINIDKLLEVDLPVLVAAAGDMVTNVIKPSIEMGTINAETAWEVTRALIFQLMQALGTEDSVDLPEEPDEPDEPEETNEPEEPNELEEPEAPGEAQASDVAEFFPGQDLASISEEYRERLNAAILDYLESSRPITSFRNEFRRTVSDGFYSAFITGFADAGAGGMIPFEDQSWLNSRVEQEIIYADELFTAAKALRDSGQTDQFETFALIHAGNYANTLQSVYAEGKLRGDRNKMLTFGGPDGDESCGTCQSLKGVRQPASWWISQNLIPGPVNPNYDCGGWRCQHQLFDDQGRPWTGEGAA